MGTFLVQSDQTCWIGSHGTYMTSELVQPVWVFTVVLCLARLCVSVCLRYWGDCPEFILSLRPNCGLIGSRICPFASLIENGPIGVSANCRALFGHLIVMVWDISDIYPYLQCNWDISFFFGVRMRVHSWVCYSLLSLLPIVYDTSWICFSTWLTLLLQKN